MTTQNWIRILNIIAIIGATVGGAAIIPNLNFPPHVLAIGLFVAAVAKAIASELVQPKGLSDEQQGITPGQQAAKTGSAGSGGMIGMFLALLCAGFCLTGCKTDATTTAVNADAVVITSVNGIMGVWAAQVRAGKATPQQIETVSNSYFVYYNSQLVCSNLAYAYTVNPSTNLSSAVKTATQAVSASASNVVAIINAFK